VDAAAKKLARFTAMDAGTVRQDTIVERMHEVRAVRAKAAAYADLIGLQQERVVAALATLEAQALEVVVKGDVMVDPDSLTGPEVTFIPAPAPAIVPVLEPAHAHTAAEGDSDLLAVLTTD